MAGGRIGARTCPMCRRSSSSCAKGLQPRQHGCATSRIAPRVTAAADPGRSGSPGSAHRRVACPNRLEAIMIRVGVLGSGEVGQTLAAGFKKHGYDVRIGSRSPEKLAAFSAKSGVANGTFHDVAAWADSLVLAVLGTAALDVLAAAEAAALDGKVLIDTTNPIENAPPEDGVVRVFTGPNESLMERL